MNINETGYEFNKETRKIVSMPYGYITIAEYVDSWVNEEKKNPFRLRSAIGSISEVESHYNLDESEKSYIKNALERLNAKLA